MMGEDFNEEQYDDSYAMFCQQAVNNEPKYLNVKEGVFKLAKAELLGLIAGGVSILTLLLSYIIREATIGLALSMGLVVFVTAIVAMVMTIQGLKTAALDVSEFQNLLTIYIISMVISLIGGFAEDIEDILDIVSSILKIVYTIKLLNLIADILKRVERADTVEKVLGFRKIFITYYVFTIVLPLAMGIGLVIATANGSGVEMGLMKAYIVLLVVELIFAVVVAIRSYTTLNDAAEAM